MINPRSGAIGQRRPDAIEAQMKVTKARLEESKAEGRRGMEEEKAPMRSTDYISVSCSI